MRIDSVLPNRAAPGQSVVVQGDGLNTTEKVFFGHQEVLFEVDGETLVVEVESGTFRGCDVKSHVVSDDVEDVVRVSVQDLSPP